MSALAGTLRATLRLRGTLLFWIFFGLLSLLSVAMLQFGDAAKAAPLVAMILGFAAWMGWLLFLSRLWQLQQHAESLQLPGARRNAEGAAVLFVLVGTSLPSLLMIALGVPSGWALLSQWLSLSTALLYLMLTPAFVVLLLVVVVAMSKVLGRPLQALLPEGEALHAGLWLMVSIFLFVGVLRWRRLLRWSGDAGWNAPQVITMAERGLSGRPTQHEDPTVHWISSAGARVPASAGPVRPTLSLSVLLCGPLAPLGWRNYLQGSAWMLLAIGFLGLLALTADPGRSGPRHALLAMLGVWSVAMPLALITRLRKLWRDEGHGLAEAALLPGLVTPERNWLSLVLMVLQTTGFRLLLPAVAISLLVILRTGDPTAPLPLLGVAGWALLLCCAFLPLARRRSVWAGFLLYTGISLVLIGVIAALVASEHMGVGIWQGLLLPLSIPVLMLALAGWAWPPRGRALVQP